MPLYYKGDNFAVDSFKEKDQSSVHGRVLCVAPLYTDKTNVSRKFLMYLEETIDFYINNLNFSKIELPFSDISDNVLKLLSQERFKSYVNLINYTMTQHMFIIFFGRVLLSRTHKKK